MRISSYTRYVAGAIWLIGAASFFLPLKSHGTEEGRTPLLMEGKRTIYQRVLTRPGAQVFQIPNPAADQTGTQAFSVLYVYDRLSVNDNTWVEVGAGKTGGVNGWIPTNQVIDWKQTIVVAFGNPAGRNRLPLYKDRDAARKLLESKDAVQKNHIILGQVALGQFGQNSPAVSIEPQNYVNFQENFYLLPILEAEQMFFTSGFKARLLKVASVTADGAPLQAKRNNSGKDDPRKESDKTDFPSQSQSGSGETASAAESQEEGAKQRHDTGIAFVIDATKSMGPYIHEVRKVVGRILDNVDSSGLGGQVSFALVGYRDNIESKPELEYVSKVFTFFKDGADSTTFMDRARHLEPASSSTIGFDEDAYAGIKTAINELNWGRFAAKYLILITDAAPRDASDPLATTGLNAEGVRQLALDKGIAMYALHLLTPEGKDNHEAAAANLRTFSDHPKGNLYYAVRAGEREQFGKVVDRIAADLIQQIKLVSTGEDEPEDFAQAKDSSPSSDPELERLRQATANVGYAMRLAYLGNIEGTQAPSVFEAWLADRDVSHPEVPALEVRMLLTKNQLSDLQEALRAIIEAGEKGQLSPEDFFDEIRSAAAVLSRTPESVGRGDFKNLSESGLLGEYLAGLPYQSKVMNVTQDIWLSWSIGEQQAFLDEIEAKIKLYQQFHDDVDRWINLSNQNVPGEAVYPVPLDSLP